MGVKLTHRQRVGRMFQRQDHDRTPRHESFWDETIVRWEKEGLCGGRQTIFRMLETDFRWVGWCWPTPFAKQNKLLSEDAETRTFINDWGATVRQHKTRESTPEHVGFECESPEIWRSKYKPALLDPRIQVDIPAAKRAQKAADDDQGFRIFACPEAFEMMRMLIGDEIMLIGMASDPEWIADIARTLTTFIIHNLTALTDAGVAGDGMYVGGDMAYNHGTFCSPSMYRELVWPQHKRLADWCHQHGMKFVYHSDGDVRSVIPLYLEAGFDCLNPLEAKAGMDLRDLVPRYGRRLSFWGNMNMQIAGTNDLDRIDQELRTKFAAGMSSKGYVFHSDHSVPSTVSWQTYQFIIDRVGRYGNYA
ncbi:MAG TPA: uroporphyrinogen decarboxylase family protein [Tepidisphaeraceae bacterium]|jgi:uroporphyrinogen decarboxylase